MIAKAITGNKMQWVFVVLMSVSIPSYFIIPMGGWLIFPPIVVAVNQFKVLLITPNASYVDFILNPFFLFILVQIVVYIFVFIIVARYMVRFFSKAKPQHLLLLTLVVSTCFVLLTFLPIYGVEEEKSNLYRAAAINIFRF